MDTTTATATATPTDFTDFVFTQPSLPAEHYAEFFTSAPRDTLVEVDGELYRFSPSGLWLALDELVTESNFGSPYGTFESYAPEALVARVESYGVPVRVLRLGDGNHFPEDYAEREARRVADHLNAVNRRLAEERAAASNRG